jgi:hypothetical protein
MLPVALIEGAPDEPDTGDRDALCSTPGPNQFIETLFVEVASFALPRAMPIRPTGVGATWTRVKQVVLSRLGHAVPDQSADIVTHRWRRGSEARGVDIWERECTETTAFPMDCYWETHGLPGMDVRWNFSLEHAGQLGFAAYRHGRLICVFDDPTDQYRFAEVRRNDFGRTPRFGPLPAQPDRWWSDRKR